MLTLALRERVAEGRVRGFLRCGNRHCKGLTEQRWLQPELGDPIWCLNMNVHSAFFVAVEEKPVTADPYYVNSTPMVVSDLLALKLFRCYRVLLFRRVP